MDRMTSLNPPWPVAWAVEHLELEAVALGVSRCTSGRGRRRRARPRPRRRPHGSRRGRSCRRARRGGSASSAGALRGPARARAAPRAPEPGQLDELRIAGFAEDVVGLLDAGQNVLVLAERGYDRLDLRRAPWPAARTQRARRARWRPRRGGRRSPRSGFRSAGAYRTRSALRPAGLARPGAVPRAEGGG